MATVTITVTDSPGGVIAVVESKPPFLFDGEDPDMEKLTNAQGFVILMLMSVDDDDGNFEWRQLVRP